MNNTDLQIIKEDLFGMEVLLNAQTVGPFREAMYAAIVVMRNLIKIQEAINGKKGS